MHVTESNIPGYFGNGLNFSGSLCERSDSDSNLRRLALQQRLLHVGTVRNMTGFDTANHWMIDRGDGSGLPSVNLAVLSFVQPLKLLDKTNDSQTVNGVPIGMTSAIVSYFTAHNIRVMLSIGGHHLYHVLGPGAFAECHAVGIECGGRGQESGRGY